jgi:hypothetical protein
MCVCVGVSLYNMFVFTKTMYMYVFIRYLESITQVLYA